MRVDVVADRQLTRRNDAFGLEADVEQHLVAVDLDDAAGDDVAVVELDDGGVDRVGERLTAEVVEHDQAVGSGWSSFVVRLRVSAACRRASPASADSGSTASGSGGVATSVIASGDGS